MNRKPYALAVVGLLVCGLAAGQDVVEGKLATARSDYEKSVEKLRGGLSAELRKKAEAAQKAGDLKGLEAIEAEAKAFEDKGVLPKSVPLKSYEADLRKAKAKLEDAYTAAVKEHTKAGQRAQAKAVQQELDEFKRGSPPTSPAKGGVLTPGGDGWVQLFNGKDLTGWQNGGNPRAVWKVEGGIIVGRTPAPATVLVSTKSNYKNFHFRITTMLSENSNSSQNFRNYRVFIGGTNPAEFGKTGELHKGGDILIKAPGVMLKPGEWFTQEIIARGNRISVLVNGKMVVDYEEKAGPPVAARFELMCRGDSTVRFKRIEVKELPDE